MTITTSYMIKIKGYNNIFNATIAIYREALAFIINVIDAEWEVISYVGNSTAQFNAAERLIHSTSKNTAAYAGFDSLFYKFPSYLRRAAISEAIGIVSSYRSNTDNWISGGRKGNPPKLRLNHYAFPCLFRGNMFKRLSNRTAQIKIWHKNDWVWLTVVLRKSDADYIARHKASAVESSPTLTQIGRNWYLRFAFTETAALSDNQSVITAVDLGVNNAAVCCAMLPDGTVIGRKIVSFPVEKDQMEHKLNKLKKAQQHGAKSTPRLWAYVNNCNRDISEGAARAIIDFATKYNSDVIVMESLNFTGKKRGSKKQRLHLWRKKAVLAMVSSKAHLLGMRVSTVCAWGTSKLAFDGSGVVVRDEDNHSLCTFTNGKRYHCDLSASYNIGARYYIREILKSLPETVRLACEAKVPRIAKRTTCTLSDLFNLHAALAA